MKIRLKNLITHIFGINVLILTCCTQLVFSQLIDNKANKNTSVPLSAKTDSLVLPKANTGKSLSQINQSDAFVRFNIKGQGKNGQPDLGYVAIGNFDESNPNQMKIPKGYRLVVQDGILTEKMKVAVKSAETDWADYVFEDSYKKKILTLSNLEKYIKENKHLPNIPSADEMVKNGLDVSEITKLLLEKIEEQALYLIEMKKEIEELKKENLSIKKVKGVRR